MGIKLVLVTKKSGYKDFKQNKLEFSSKTQLMNDFNTFKMISTKQIQINVYITGLFIIPNNKYAYNYS